MPLYEYFCACGISTEGIYKYDEKPKTLTCPECGGTAEYHVSKPAYFRIKFDNHGRVGFKHDMGNGKQTYRSATKENYEHNLGNKSGKALKEMGSDKNRSVYTKEYGRVKDAEEKVKAKKFTEAVKAIQKGD